MWHHYLYALRNLNVYQEKHPKLSQDNTLTWNQKTTDIKPSQRQVYQQYAVNSLDQTFETNNKTAHASRESFSY